MKDYRGFIEVEEDYFYEKIKEIEPTSVKGNGCMGLDYFKDGDFVAYFDHGFVSNMYYLKGTPDNNKTTTEIFSNLLMANQMDDLITAGLLQMDEWYETVQKAADNLQLKGVEFDVVGDSLLIIIGEDGYELSDSQVRFEAKEFDER